jgi:hypothetical protein
MVCIPRTHGNNPVKESAPTPDGHVLKPTDQALMCLYSCESAQLSIQSQDPLELLQQP